jgi:hypothetical protein
VTPASPPPDRARPAEASPGEPSTVRASTTIDGYLAEVAARLPGPARLRYPILAELRSGLLDAAEAYQAAGQTPDAAARAAVLDFGAPGPVAAGFQAELASRQARQVAIAVLVTGPLTGLLWLLTAVASHLGPDLPGLGTGLSPGARGGLVLVAAAIVGTAWAAAAGIAATGRLTRWLPVRPGRAPLAAALAGFCAAAADGLGVTVLAAELVLAPGRLALLPAVLATVAGLTRLALAGRAARRCLTTRAALA